ncbi:MAG: RNA polymerase sporulation sigma factor SigK [Oscillospiraceae bacterium]|nr:RNA polymerase sporulation sigma factor SigK [Oscillospiraceae bacterium]
MLPISILLLLNGIFFTLRLSGGSSFPRPLRAEEEQEYLARAAAGDLDARNLLIEHNLRLVAHIIKKYYTQTTDQDDLISIGTIGLIKGVSTYNPQKGARLATYAARCIENEVLMHFRAQKRAAGEVSLSETIDTDKDGNALSLMDVVSTDDNLLENLHIKENCRQLRQSIAQVLTPREMKIIVQRYGLNNEKPKTQREIAADCGISRSYVSRIEKKALEKLRHTFQP